MSKLTLFNGGLNTRQDPTLIASNEAVECENVDTSTGVLKSAKGKTATTQAITNTPYYWEKESEWQDRAGSLEYLEHQDYLYWTTTTSLKKYDGTTVSNAGLVAPTVKPNVTLSNTETPTYITSTQTAFTYTFTLAQTSIASGVCNAPGAGNVIADSTKNFSTLGVRVNDPVSFAGATKQYYVSSLVSSFLIAIKDANNVIETAAVVGIGAGYDVGRINTIASGTSNSAGTNQLIDTARSPDFINAGVSPGMHVSNETTGTICFVNTVSSTSITLVDGSGSPINAFGSGQSYIIGSIAATYNYQLVLATSGNKVHFETKSITTSNGGSVTCTVTSGANISTAVVNTLLNYSAFTTFSGCSNTPYLAEEPSILPTAGSVVTFGVSVASGTILAPLTTDVTVEANPSGGVKFITLFSSTATVGATLNFYYKSGPFYYLIQSSTALSAIFNGGLVLINLPTWAAAGLNGTYQYVYTYYNSTEDLESAPSPLSSEISVENNFVNLSSIAASSDSTVDYVRVYRVGGNLSDFFLAAEQVDTQSTYLDTNADSNLTSIMTSMFNTVPPSGLRYIRSIFGVFLGAVDYLLYFTRDIGNPNYWPATNYIDFDVTITGIGVLSIGAVVFTRYRSYLITGSSANTFAKHLLSGDQGCINHSTIVSHKGTLIFVSTDGICTTAGNDVVVASKFKLGKQTLSTINACVHDETYYLQLSDNSILAFDFRYEPNIRTFDFGTNYVLTALDTLYARQITSNLMATLFSGDSSAFTYKTGELTEGSVSLLKSYNKVYIKTKVTTETFVVKIYIDGTLRLTQTLTGSLLYEVTPPQDYQQGYNIQFEITGTGTIQEIEYKPVGRATGD